jgi:hypothetical protein
MRPFILFIAAKKVYTRGHSHCNLRIGLILVANTMLSGVVIKQPDKGFDGDYSPITAVWPKAFKLIIRDHASPISLDSISSGISTGSVNHEALS